MKKLLALVIIIAACAALCAPVWPRCDTDGEVPTETDNGELSAYTDELPRPIAAEYIPLSDDTLVMPTRECAAPEPVEETAEKEDSPDELMPDNVANPATQGAPRTAIEPTPKLLTQSANPASADPYHTDVYPNNVYSEELIYDEVGNLIGKTTTYPTAFGPDTIWIDGHAYYDLPGFGLVEWSGPSRRTADYTMYESGVKVGIMGGEDEAPTRSTPAPSEELPEPTGEVIDQTINTRPERNSTPPDYKPELTPPADQNARDIG